MGDGLTLEKMKVAEKLESYESTQNSLIKSVDNLDKSVNEIKAVLFGEKGENGVVHEMRELKNIANIIKASIGKALWALMGIIGLGLLPYITEILNKITHTK